MKKLIALFCTSLLAAGTMAADVPAGSGGAKTEQQNRMVTCNAEATGKKGDERKGFMKTCLSNKPELQVTAQQSKMKTCNAEAAGKKGEERKAFMKTCLSAK